MPVITSIKPQKNGKRVNIYLDGEFGFGLDIQTFLKEKLKIEQELTQDQIISIVKKGEFQDSYDKILMFAAIRPRSKKEYELWLRKHKVHASLHQELFDRLERLDLLNDKKFASWWVQQRQAFRPKSNRVLILELKLKGIDAKTAEDVLSEEELDEKNTAKKMLDRKLTLWNKLEPFERRKKIYGFLSQRGFDYELIRDILDELEDELQ